MNPEIFHTNPDNSLLGKSRKAFVENLRWHNQSVALVEGCTGGAISSAITVPGATRIINGAIAPYSREAKIRMGVSEEIIDTYGEYAPQVALAMARLSQRKEGTDIGIGITGDLGDGGIVHTAYILKDQRIFVDAVIPSARTRRMKNNEIAVRVLTNANALIMGHKPRFDIPILGNLEDPFSDEYDALEESADNVMQRCENLGLTLGTMESCTGLAMANALTNVSGSQEIFKTGFLAYNEDVKRQLGVPIEAMARGGVYSKEVAAAMAEAVVERTGVDIGFATTGVTDVWDTREYHQGYAPGTVSLAIAQRGEKTWAETQQFPVDTRDRMKIAITGNIFNQFIQLSDRPTLQIIRNEQY